MLMGHARISNNMWPRCFPFDGSASHGHIPRSEIVGWALRLPFGGNRSGCPTNRSYGQDS